MKAEHRKELQTNVLADRLGKAFHGMKEGPSRGTVLTVGAVALAALLIFLWWYFWTTSRDAASARWVQWDGLTSPAALESFAQIKDSDARPMTQLARFQLARLSLLEGLRELGTPRRKEAQESIRKAAKLYEELATESADSPLLAQEALLGAGKANESLGEIDRAKDYYRQLVDKHPNTAFGKDAKSQLDRLTGDGKEVQELANELKAPAGS